MSNLEKFIWIIACFFVIPLGFLLIRVVGLLKNNNNEDIVNELAASRQETAEARNQIQILNDQRVTEGKASHEKEMKRFHEIQATFQRTLTNDLLNLNKELKTEITNQIVTESKTINDSVNQVNRLFKTSTKHTGQLGEVLLKRMLKNIQAIGAKNKFLTIEEQVKLVNGRRPDLVIKSPEPNVPPIYIDAKFPVHMYEALIDNSHAKNLRDELVKAVKKEVAELSKKYVTTSFDINNASEQASFVVMFLPSDGIYYELMNSDQIFGQDERTTGTKEKMTFIEFCFSKFVVPISPSTIIGLLSTIERYWTLFNQLKESDEQLLVMNQISKKYNDLVDSINDIIKIFNNLAVKLEKLQKPFQQIEKITNRYPELLHEIKSCPQLKTNKY